MSQARKKGICPYTRLGANPAGGTCKESCAWWDDVNMQCSEITKLMKLIGINEHLGLILVALTSISNKLLILNGEGDGDGNRETDTDQN